MFLKTNSIRGKIAAGYLLSLFSLILVASILFAGLVVVEGRVEYYFCITRFFDTALEMRRYEKNYLLYRRREDLEEAMRYAEAASALAGGDAGSGKPSCFRRHDRGWLLARDPGTPDLGPERTVPLLREYAALLRAAAEAKAVDGAPETTAVEASVRDLGRRITAIAERLSAVEGRNIQDMLRSGRGALILLVVLFLLGTAVVARVVLLTAIRPLKELEDQMQRIAAGRYQLLPAGSGDDEISSMSAAFNRMIREVFEHRQEKIQSERLAALGTALAGIAHEINNPLSNISTSAEILREQNQRADPGERGELIDQIISQTDRATDIIRAVLDFTREPRLERRSTNLASAIRGSLILVSHEMPPQVSVRIDVAPALEVLADKTRLEQAFINLLTNAIDALRAGGRERRIAVSALPSGDAEVEIVFRDTGAGIPRHLVDRIFDPFFTTKDVGEGAGLGLYLTHQIVEQLGGAIRVESTVGEGTAFFIRLPRGDSGTPPRPEGPKEARG
jgi:two-component system, NtrC family, sensor kinase